MAKLHDDYEGDIRAAKRRQILSDLRGSINPRMKVWQEVACVFITVLIIVVQVILHNG